MRCSDQSKGERVLGPMSCHYSRPLGFSGRTQKMMNISALTKLVAVAANEIGAKEFFHFRREKESQVE
jgi:hypothetical protein